MEVMETMIVLQEHLVLQLIIPLQQVVLQEEAAVDLKARAAALKQEEAAEEIKSTQSIFFHDVHTSEGILYPKL